MSEEKIKMVGVVYAGPSEFIRVAPYGRHYKGKTREYPEEFALDLVKTSKKQVFKLAVAGKGGK